MVAEFSIDPFWLLAAIIPIKSYSNAEDDKDKILKENKDKSGIYMWKNKKNGKKYIGSAIDLLKRLSSYYSTTYMEDALTRSNSHIYRALLKNGHSNFSLTILEYCEPEKCLIREKHYLDLLPHEYNIAQDPTAPMFGRTHSDATKKIMSDAKKGTNHTEETKKIMSDAKKGNTNGLKKGEPRPEGSGSPSQAIEVVDIINNITTYYISMHEAARVLNISNFNIIRNYIIRNQKKPYKGQYIFKKF